MGAANAWQILSRARGFGRCSLDRPPNNGSEPALGISIMRSYTEKCGHYGHPEISVQCEDTAALSPSLRWFLAWIESEVARGRRFLPMQTVQVGWSVLEIRQRTDDTLALFEPDFKSMPVRLVDS